MMAINQERAVKILEEMIAYPHPQEEMEKVKGFIAESIKPTISRLPFDSVRIDDRGNLIAVKKGRSDDPPLVICTYGGCYPAGNMTDPYSPGIVDGAKFGLKGPCMWGRGSAELLAAEAAMLEAVVTFFDESHKIQRDLIWVTNYAGEMGNHEAVDHIFLNQEVPMGPTLLAYTSNNAISLGNLGRIDVVLTIEGVSCHSSDPAKGKNSIDGLYEILGKVQKFPYLETDSDLGKATLTPTTIKTWPEALHTVPGYTKLILDRRLIPGEDPAIAFKQMKEYLGREASGLKISYEDKLNFQYPHKANPDCTLVKATKQASQDVLGTVGILYQRYALDMGFFSHNGQDCITFGPGDPGLAHSDYEMVSLEDFYNGARVYLAVLRKLLL